MIYLKKFIINSWHDFVIFLFYEDVNNESKGFLKASDPNKSKGRNKAVKNHQFAPFDEKHLKTWNKIKDAKNKNKKPKNKKPKNPRQLQISTPQNDDPTQNSRNQKIKNFDERVRVCDYY